MRKKNLNSRFGDYFLTVCLLHFRGIRMPLLTILSAFKQKNRQRFIIFGSFFMWKKASWPSNMCHAVYDINLKNAQFKKGQKVASLLSIFKVLQPICLKILANLLQKQVKTNINFLSFQHPTTGCTCILCSWFSTGPSPRPPGLVRRPPGLVRRPKY
jgi:hypothetical protein